MSRSFYKICAIFCFIVGSVWGDEDLDEDALIDEVLDELMGDVFPGIEGDDAFDLDSILEEDDFESLGLKLTSPDDYTSFDSLSLGVNSGWGHRGNVMYQPKGAEVDSVYKFLGFDLMGQFQFDGTGDQLSLMIFGDGSRFLDGGDLADDVFAYTQIGYLTDRFGVGPLGIGLEGVYTTSSFEVDEAEPVMVDTGRKGKVSLNWEPRLLTEKSEWVFSYGRYLSDFESSTYNFSEFVYSEDFEIKKGSHLLMEMEGIQKRYPYALMYDDDGDLLEGESKEIDRLRAELTWKNQLSVGASKLLTELSVDRFQESSSASRYYDRNSSKVGGRIDWKYGAWNIDVRLSYRKMNYDVRKVSSETDLEEMGNQTLDESDVSWSVEIEREFGGDWLAYLSYNRSDVESNDPDSSYETDNIQLGLRTPPIFIW